MIKNLVQSRIEEALSQVDAKELRIILAEYTRHLVESIDQEIKEKGYFRGVEGVLSLVDDIDQHTEVATMKTFYGFIFPGDEDETAQ